MELIKKLRKRRLEKLLHSYGYKLSDLDNMITTKKVLSEKINENEVRIVALEDRIKALETKFEDFSKDGLIPEGYSMSDLFDEMMTGREKGKH